MTKEPGIKNGLEDGRYIVSCGDTRIIVDTKNKVVTAFSNKVTVDVKPALGSLKSSEISLRANFGAIVAGGVMIEQLEDGNLYVTAPGFTVVHKERDIRPSDTLRQGQQQAAAACLLPRR